jgi:DNA repair exonuclease SbcCD ATPase subunit
MEISELIRNLTEDAEKIKQEKIEELDFDRLEENLNSASEILKKLKGKERTSEKILEDYKSEIKRLALSLSRLKGENANLELIEKYLREENLSYEELSLLRKQLKSEFDKNFPTSPVSKTFYPFSEVKRAKDKITEFKV